MPWSAIGVAQRRRATVEGLRRSYAPHRPLWGDCASSAKLLNTKPIGPALLKRHVRGAFIAWTFMACSLFDQVDPGDGRPGSFSTLVQSGDAY
jgi:hypothetical protein